MRADKSVDDVVQLSLLPPPVMAAHTCNQGSKGV
jgi:hypothetical protein